MKYVLLSLSIITTLSCNNKQNQADQTLYKVNTLTIGIYNESDFDSMKKYISNKNFDKYQSLFLNDKAIILNIGDECQSENIDTIKTKCECITSKGKKTVWVNSKFLD